MNIKTVIISIAFYFLFIGVAFTQVRTSYYDAKGKPVRNPDSADYKREISLSDTATSSPMYNVTDTYMNGKLRLTGKMTQLNGTILEGRCVRYYPNGNLRQIANYTVGLMNGNTYDYYPNGKLYRMIRYEIQHPSANRFVGVMPLIKICNDSTGNAQVIDGNGEYIGYSDNFKAISEEGYVKDGLKIGQWKGHINDTRLKIKFEFIESYDKGKLITGKSIDEDGQQQTYMQRDVNPAFKGGEVEFNNFLREHIHYPREAKSSNIQGRVFISFVVEKDGKLTDMKVVRTPAESLSEESLRVLSQSPVWIPGSWYGHPVKVSYTVPINFALAGR